MGALFMCDEYVYSQKQHRYDFMSLGFIVQGAS